MPPEQEVDCPHGGAMERPVLFDPTGRNRRVTACVACGTVSVTDAQVDEPCPHDVRNLGNTVLGIPEDAREWLALWPRLVWNIDAWNGRRTVYLPATLRVATPAELAAAERDALAASASDGLDRGGRLRQAGIPEAPAPASLPASLRHYAAEWSGLHLPADMPLDELIARTGRPDHAAPYAQEALMSRPDLPDLLADLLRSPLRSRLAAGLALAGRADLPETARPVAIAGLIARLRAIESDEQATHALLDVLYRFGPAAAEARPLLKEMADRVEARDYYLAQRLLNVRDLLKPPGGGAAHTKHPRD
jgi:hypothetical protein